MGTKHGLNFLQGITSAAQACLIIYDHYLGNSKRGSLHLQMLECWLKTDCALTQVKKVINTYLGHGLKKLLP